MMNAQQKSTEDDFEFQSTIGKGSYGVVFKVKRKVDGSTYVIKQINLHGMDKRGQQETIKEVQILAALDHPNVIRYYDSFISKEGNLNIVMEYAAKGTLYDVLKKRNGSRLPEKKVWSYFIQILQGLHYVHRQKILHRDMKTLNIFLDHNDHVKIGDFGVSKILNHTRSLAQTFVGTPYYLSPELCENKPYGERSDVWALGCILYEMCTFKHPFEANNHAALILKIMKGKYSPISTTYSKELSKLIQYCLCLQAESRPSTYQLLSLKIVIEKSRDGGHTFSSTSASLKGTPSKKDNQNAVKEVVSGKPSVLSPRPSSGRSSRDLCYGPIKVEDEPIQQIVLRQNRQAPCQRPGSARQRIVISRSNSREECLRNVPAKKIINERMQKKLSHNSKYKEIEAVRNLPEVPLVRERRRVIIRPETPQLNDSPRVVLTPRDRTRTPKPVVSQDMNVQISLDDHMEDRIVEALELQEELVPGWRVIDQTRESIRTGEIREIIVKQHVSLGPLSEYKC